LQYAVKNPGKGTSPSDSDFVTVQYKGHLINGNVFDSSYDRGQPTTFRVTDVIPGWSEALKLMKPGAKWTLFVPPQLAYGAHGMGSKIGPNEALIFDIELIKVSKERKSKS